MRPPTGEVDQNACCCITPVPLSLQLNSLLVVEPPVNCWLLQAVGYSILMGPAASKPLPPSHRTAASIEGMLSDEKVNIIEP